MATASATLNNSLSVSPTTGSELEFAEGNDSGSTAKGAVAKPFASQVMGDPMGMLKDVIRQPSVKKMLPLVVIMLVVAAFGLASMSMKSPSYKALNLMLPEADKQIALDALKTADFKTEIDENTGQIMVPTTRYQEAKMLIASKGLPHSDMQGMEGLKDMPAMTTSQFMEQVRYNNAMEQELAKSISQIAGIKNARVHLAAPKQTVFVRDRVPTKASVVITRAPGKIVSAANVQAIIQLVSASVPYLAPENVSVVDNYGSLMNDMLLEAPLGMTAAQLQQKQQMEDLYRTRLIQLLAPIVGEANVSAQVSINLDFTQQETTTEDFDERDKGPKTRSELFVEDRNTFKDAIGIPGSLSNTPPNPPQNPSATPNTTADISKGLSEKGVQVTARSTKNYELDRAVRHTTNQMGTIQRMGVGVLINERPIPSGMKVEKPADGMPPQTTIPYTQEELDRLNQLVRGAVGFNNDRGDVVTVVSTHFEPPIDPDAVPWYKDEGVASIANSAGIAVLFALFLLLVVRPVVKRMTKPEIDPAELAKAALAAATAEASVAEKMRAERIAQAEAEASAKAIADRAARESAIAEAKLAEEARRAAEERAKIEAEMFLAREAQEERERQAAKEAAGAENPDQIQMEEGETMDDLKAKMANMKPKKQVIPADLLDTANTYDDKVALIRMIVSDNSTRVAGVLKNMIQQ